jgi:hypothetical protein
MFLSLNLLLIMQFSPTSYHFIPLRSKYSPQHPVELYDTHIASGQNAEHFSIKTGRALNCKLTRSSGKNQRPTFLDTTRATLKTMRGTILYIVACVFVAAVTFLPSRYQSKLRGFLPSRCLATIWDIHRLTTQTAT